MRRFPILALDLALALMVPVGAAAQTVWDAPSFMRAGAPTGLTLALTDYNPGDNLAVVGLWRTSPAPLGLGFRAGIAEDPTNDVVALFGIDVSGGLPGLTGSSSAQALWWTGAGVSVGNDLTASFPLGLSFSFIAHDESVDFIPWGGAHVALDVNPPGNNDDLDLSAAIDLGLDLAFPSGWVARFSAALADRDALGIGMRIPR